jgi:predicted O-methyltransferase YrrM
MRKITFQINSLFTYKFKAINVHHLHSPFAYEMVRNVINDNRYYTDYMKVSALRNELQDDRSEIMVTDFGAGIGGKGYVLVQKSIASLYKNNSIRLKYGQLLYRLVKHLQPTYILELGTSLGISSAFMAFAAPEASIVTVEGCKGIAEKATENFTKLGLTNIKQKTGNFDSVLDTIINDMPKIDFAFIDGNHRKDPTIRYFESCLKKSHNNTVLIFDDIHWSEEMNEAWRFIQSHQSVTLTLDLFQFGIVFFRKELSKQDFIISY